MLSTFQNKFNLFLCLFSEEEVLFEDTTSEAVLNPIGTVEVRVAIVQDEMERQTPQLFSPEVTIIPQIYFLPADKMITRICLLFCRFSSSTSILSSTAKFVCVFCCRLRVWEKQPLKQQQQQRQTKLQKLLKKSKRWDHCSSVKITRKHWNMKRIIWLFSWHNQIFIARFWLGPQNDRATI